MYIEPSAVLSARLPVYAWPALYFRIKNRCDWFSERAGKIFNLNTDVTYTGKSRTKGQALLRNLNDSLRLRLPYHPSRPRSEHSAKPCHQAPTRIKGKVAMDDRVCAHMNGHNINSPHIIHVLAAR